MQIHRGSMFLAQLVKKLNNFTKFFQRPSNSRAVWFWPFSRWVFQQGRFLQYYKGQYFPKVVRVGSPRISSALRSSASAIHSNKGELYTSDCKEGGGKEKTRNKAKVKIVKERLKHLKAGSSQVHRQTT